jgi:hypothetical protein
MTTDLPTNLGYGTVVGRFLLAYADSADSGSEPDGIAAVGSVFFVPSVNAVKNPTASPAPVTIMPATVECTLDAEGYLYGPQGDRGVRLIATDDPDTIPNNWYWTVKFKLTDQGGTPLNGLDNKMLTLSGGETVDLTLV